MTSPAPRPDLLAGERAEDVLDALLYSVSHDLRSPLLTLSLSGQLLRESVGAEAAERSAPVLDGLQAAAADLERMLQALTVVSRARRRPLVVTPVALDVLLDGSAVNDLPADLASAAVHADVDLAREFLDWCAERRPGAPVIELDQHVVRLLVPVHGLPEHEGSPLLALAQSLQQFAGSPLERLAGFQVAFERSGAVLIHGAGRLRLELPRVEVSP